MRATDCSVVSNTFRKRASAAQLEKAKLITCKDITETASDYIEGPNTFGQRFWFRLHLLMCRHCRRYLQQLQTAIGVARELPVDHEPTDAEIDQLVEKLKSS